MLESTITQLLRHYSADTIRGALIQHWAKLNGVPFSRLEQVKSVIEPIQSSNSTDLGKITDHISQHITKLSIKDLEASFEALLDSSRRRSHGAIYTPNYIIDYLIDHGLRMAGFTRTKSSNRTMPLICDPACGSAGFLIRAAEYLKPEIPPIKAFSQCLIGFDNDSLAIQQARCLIQLYFAPTRCSRVRSRTSSIHARYTLGHSKGTMSNSWRSLRI